MTNVRSPEKPATNEEDQHIVDQMSHSMRGEIPQEMVEDCSYILCHKAWVCFINCRSDCLCQKSGVYTIHKEQLGVIYGVKNLKAHEC